MAEEWHCWLIKNAWLLSQCGKEPHPAWKCTLRMETMIVTEATAWWFKDFLVLHLIHVALNNMQSAWTINRHDRPYHHWCRMLHTFQNTIRVESFTWVPSYIWRSIINYMKYWFITEANFTPVIFGEVLMMSGPFISFLDHSWCKLRFFTWTPGSESTFNKSPTDSSCRHLDAMRLPVFQQHLTCHSPIFLKTEWKQTDRYRRLHYHDHTLDFLALVVQAHLFRFVWPGFLPPFFTVRTDKCPSSDVTALGWLFWFHRPKEFGHTLVLLQLCLLLIDMGIYSVVGKLWYWSGMVNVYCASPRYMTGSRPHNHKYFFLCQAVQTSSILRSHVTLVQLWIKRLHLPTDGPTDDVQNRDVSIGAVSSQSL